MPTPCLLTLHSGPLWKVTVEDGNADFPGAIRLAFQDVHKLPFFQRIRVSNCKGSDLIGGITIDTEIDQLICMVPPMFSFILSL